MNNLNKAIFITATLLLLSSCIIFKGNNLERIDAKQIRLDSAKKKKIYVGWDFDFLPMGHSSITYEDRARLFKTVLDESNCCEVVKKKSEADLIFEGKAYDQRNSVRVVGFMISAVTAYLIPSWHTAKIFVTADVKYGKDVKHYEVNDSMTTVMWLPFVVATPFAYDFDKTQKEILENSYRSLILKMKNDSVIDIKFD
jgi:hypothetical protein